MLLKIGSTHKSSDAVFVVTVAECKGLGVGLLVNVSDREGLGVVSLATVAECGRLYAVLFV